MLGQVSFRNRLANTPVFHSVRFSQNAFQFFLSELSIHEAGKDGLDIRYAFVIEQNRRHRTNHGGIQVVNGPGQTYPRTWRVPMPVFGSSLSYIHLVYLYLLAVPNCLGYVPSDRLGGELGKGHRPNFRFGEGDHTVQSNTSVVVRMIIIKRIACRTANRIGIHLSTVVTAR